MPSGGKSTTMCDGGYVPPRPERRVGYLRAGGMLRGLPLLPVCVQGHQQLLKEQGATGSPAKTQYNKYKALKRKLYVLY